VLETPMRIVSFLATGYVLLPLALVSSAILWRRRHSALALWLPAIGVIAVLVLPVIKWLISKPRPVRSTRLRLSERTCVRATIALHPRRLPACGAWRRPGGGSGRARGRHRVRHAVGYSRIYVNAHWLSDVVGGSWRGGVRARVRARDRFRVALTSSFSLWFMWRSRRAEPPPARRGGSFMIRSRKNLDVWRPRPPLASPDRRRPRGRTEHLASSCTRTSRSSIRSGRRRTSCATTAT
jgi:hypothetical protein